MHILFEAGILNGNGVIADRHQRCSFSSVPQIHIVSSVFFLFYRVNGYQFNISRPRFQYHVLAAVGNADIP